MNRGDLEQGIIDYMKRPDLAPVTPLFITQATARIAQRLQARANEVYLTGQAYTDSTFQLPSDAERLRSVVTERNGRKVILRSLNDEAAARYSTPGSGAAVGYQLRADTLYLFPPGSGVLDIGYWQRPAELSTATSTNKVLDAHPGLYLFASLIEGYIYIQDDDMAAGMANVYLAHLEDINYNERRRKLGSVPAMGAA